MGEAAGHVPGEIQDPNSSLPWTEMRNVLSRAYFLGDVAIVWKTIEDDLAKIAPVLQRIIDENPQSVEGHQDSKPRLPALIPFQQSVALAADGWLSASCSLCR